MRVRRQDYIREVKPGKKDHPHKSIIAVTIYAADHKNKTYTLTDETDL